MSGTLITNSIYNAINGVSSSSGAGGSGSVTTSLINSGTTALSGTISSNGTIALTTLPTGLAEGLYLVNLNLKVSSSTPALPNSGVATGYYIYVDQTLYPNTYSYPNHQAGGTSYAGYLTTLHPTDIFRNPYGSGNSAITTGSSNAITTPIVAVFNQAYTSITGTLYYSVNAVALLNGGVSGGGGSVSGISSLTSGTAISLTGTTTAPTINNIGVTSNVAGTGIGVSSGTGAVTITNTGVTSAVAGTGIAVSSGTGAVTITNNGVRSLTAGSGVSVSSGTGAITIANTGVTSLTAGSNISLTASTGNITISSSSVANITGTSTLTSGTNIIGSSTSGGTTTLSLPTSYTALNSIQATTGIFSILEPATIGNTSLSATGTPIRFVSNIVLNPTGGTPISLDLGSTNNTLNHLLLGTDANGNGYNFTNIGQVTTGTLQVNGVSNFYNNMLMIGNYNLSVATIGSNGGVSVELLATTPLAQDYTTLNGVTGVNADYMRRSSVDYIADIQSACPQYAYHTQPYTNGTNYTLLSNWASGTIVYIDITGGNNSILLYQTDYSQQYLKVSIQGSITFDTSLSGSPAQGYFCYLSVNPSGTSYEGTAFNSTTPYAFNLYSYLNPTVAEVLSGSVTNQLLYTFSIDDIFELVSYQNLGVNTNVVVGFNIANVDSSGNPGTIVNFNSNTTAEWITYYS